MKKPLVFLFLATAITLMGCNDIRVSLNFRYWATQTDLEVQISNARPNVRLKVMASNVPRTPDKTVYVNTDANGRASARFEYPYYDYFCDLTPRERRQRGVVVVADETNPDPDRVNSRLFDFAASPLFVRPVGGTCAYSGDNTPAPAYSSGSR